MLLRSASAILCMSELQFETCDIKNETGYNGGILAKLALLRYCVRFAQLDMVAVGCASSLNQL